VVANLTLAKGDEIMADTFKTVSFYRIHAEGKSSFSSSLFLCNTDSAPIKEADPSKSLP
jgi:hypothetical protein